MEATTPGGRTVQSEGENTETSVDTPHSDGDAANSGFVDDDSNHSYRRGDSKENEELRRQLEERIGKKAAMGVPSVWSKHASNEDTIHVPYTRKKPTVGLPDFAQPEPSPSEDLDVTINSMSDSGSGSETGTDNEGTESRRMVGPNQVLSREEQIEKLQTESARCCVLRCCHFGKRIRLAACVVLLGGFLVLGLVVGHRRLGGVSILRWCVFASIITGSSVLILLVRAVTFSVMEMKHAHTALYIARILQASLARALFFVTVFVAWMQVILPKPPRSTKSPIDPFSVIGAVITFVMLLTVGLAVKTVGLQIFSMHVQRKSFAHRIATNDFFRRQAKILLHAAKAKGVNRRMRDKGKEKEGGDGSKSKASSEIGLNGQLLDGILNVFKLEIKHNVSEGYKEEQRRAKEHAIIVYNHLRPLHSRRIRMADLRGRVPSSHAANLWKFLDSADAGFVSRAQIVALFAGVYHETIFLNQSVIDSENIVQSIDSLVSATVIFVVTLVFLALEGTNINSVLLSGGTFFLGISFVCGDAAKSLFNSLLFIFIIRPFDVGDRIQVNHKYFYRVKRIHLMSTILVTWDEKYFCIPNSLLVNAAIYNCRRSGHQTHTIPLQVDAATTLDVLEKLETSIGVFLSKHTSLFYPDFTLHYAGLQDSSRLLLELWVKQRSNFQDPNHMWDMEAMLVLMVKKIMAQLNIKFYPPTQRLQLEGLGWGLGAGRDGGQTTPLDVHLGTQGQTEMDAASSFRHRAAESVPHFTGSGVRIWTH